MSFSIIFLKRRRRDQADNTTLNSGCYGDQIGVSQWFAVGKTIQGLHKCRGDCCFRTRIFNRGRPS